jgi:hypothetical protein
MKTQTVRIKDCADVLPGFSMKGAIIDKPHGTVQVITAQHLKQGEVYRYRDEDRLRIQPARLNRRYLLKRDDILFTSRGASNYAVLLGDFPQPAIAPLTFFVLKPKRIVVPAYLVWCFEQDQVKTQLNQIRTRAGSPMIPRREFAEITVHLPSRSVQHAIALLASLESRERLLLREIASETERLHRLRGQQLLSRMTRQE